MEDKPPKRKMPEFEISKELTDELRTISAVTKVLADDPELIKDIAGIFKQVEMEKEKEIAEQVSKLLADKVDMKEEQISEVFEKLYPLIVRCHWRFASSQQNISVPYIWKFG